MCAKFGLLTYEIGHLIRHRFNKEAEKQGLTHAQWRVLVHLFENENCRQVELAGILDIKPITLVRQIDHLEESGLVLRNKDPEDRRAHRLQITAKGIAMMESLSQIAYSIETQILMALPDSEQTRLIKMLETLKKHAVTG